MARRFSFAVLAVLGVLAVLVSGTAPAETGTPSRRPPPHDYGAVVIGNYSRGAGLAPVRFDHWLHRAKYTCRLCHVDIGFAMRANGTQIHAADNRKGFYCGTCHDGKTLDGDKTIFAACMPGNAKEDRRRCERCHSQGLNVRREYDFESFTRGFPKERFGNGIDWEKAEAKGRIRPVNDLEGISIPRPPMTVQKDFSIVPAVEGMPEIIFSHKKHTAWNGCELCHPEIFTGIRKGATRYSMIEIFDGKYCGVCHRTVAFPTTDCQRCHSQPVR